jgi:hypothetical protein
LALPFFDQAHGCLLDFDFGRQRVLSPALLLPQALHVRRRSSSPRNRGREISCRILTACVCTENLIRVADVTESPKLAESYQ